MPRFVHWPIASVHVKPLHVGSLGETGSLQPSAKQALLTQTDLALLWLRCGHQEFCTRIAVEQFQRVAQRHRVLVGCAAASMRYHDEIRVFSRLMAKSVVGNNQ